MITDEGKQLGMNDEQAVARASVEDAITNLERAWKRFVDTVGSRVTTTNSDPARRIDPGIPAREVSWCFVCDDTIDVGQRIIRRADGDGQKRWMHAECQQGVF